MVFRQLLPKVPRQLPAALNPAWRFLTQSPAFGARRALNLLASERCREDMKDNSQF